MVQVRQKRCDIHVTIGERGEVTVYVVVTCEWSEKREKESEEWWAVSVPTHSQDSFVKKVVLKEPSPCHPSCLDPHRQPLPE